MIEVGALDSPLGELRFARREGRLLALAFAEGWPRPFATLCRRLGGVAIADARGPGELSARLGAYFAGDLASLETLPIELVGTAFQRAVWQRLRGVRPGTTIAYGELARALGVPRAARAVGAANGANPLWLVVPCHRAIGANGALTGYAGGLQRKRWLLEHEQAALSAR